MASQYFCNNPDESDDCGGWCLTHKCENCKYAEKVIINEKDGVDNA